MKPASTRVRNCAKVVCLWQRLATLAYVGRAGHAWLQAYAYLEPASGSIPLFLIVSGCVCGRKKFDQSFRTFNIS